MVDELCPRDAERRVDAMTDAKPKGLGLAVARPRMPSLMHWNRHVLLQHWDLLAAEEEFQLSHRRARLRSVVEGCQVVCRARPQEALA